MSPQCSKCQKPKAEISRSTIYSVSDYGGGNEKQPSHRSSRCDESSNIETYKSISDCDHERRHFYRPRSNRTWVFAIFLVAIAVCILLLELAVAAHPAESEVHGVGKRDTLFAERHVLQIRQDSSATSTTGEYYLDEPRQHQLTISWQMW